MKYQITIKKTAAKELESLPVKIATRITALIYTLGDNPRPSGVKKLKGEHGQLWRVRLGDYRVLYSIEEEIKIIDIQKIGHRKDIYE
jgi:mRNA interferase RelE/StbE